MLVISAANSLQLNGYTCSATGKTGSFSQVTWMKTGAFPCVKRMAVNALNIHEYTLQCNYRCLTAVSRRG